MAAEKTCQVCGKSDAIGNCEQCGKALCEICRKGYFHQELGPHCQTLGMQLSQIWSGEKTMYYCPECFKTIDVYERPRGW